MLKRGEITVKLLSQLVIIITSMTFEFINIYTAADVNIQTTMLSKDLSRKR